MRSSHLSQKYSLEDTTHWDLPRKIVSCEQKIEGYLTDLTVLKENTHPNVDGGRGTGTKTGPSGQKKTGPGEVSKGAVWDAALPLSAR